MDQQDSKELGRRSPNIIGGLLLIVLGVIFLADRQGWQLGWHLSFSRLWPLLLVAIGIGRIMGGHDDAVDAAVIVNQRRGRGRLHRVGRGGAWLIFLGVLFLLHTNHVLSLDHSWPLFIVWGGVMILLGRRPIAEHRKTDDVSTGGSPQV